MSDEIIGTRKGDYEILGVLGAGGMGKVYKVRNVLSDRIEAMKVLLPNLADQKDLADRFLREIKTLAALSHPNIASLRTALTIDNQLVMIMEYVEGTTLSARVARGAIPCGEAIQYICQVLDALSYAHQHQIIHRDIKPANMMLTTGGVVKLMDFGIARSGVDGGMTTTGTTLGSLAYMSPEQVKCEPVDGRSDLYSVGVSFYEMVTGQRPFQSDSNFSIMQAHLQEPPRQPLELNPSLPPGVSEIIMIAMAKKPGDRFQSAEAFRNALQSVADSLGVATLSTAQVAALAPTPAASTPTPANRRSGTAPVTSPRSPQTPVASPAAAAAPSAAMSPPHSSGATHRSLYVGLGAFLVLVVLGAAAFSLPRFLGTRAGSKNRPPANASSVPVTPAEQAQPAAVAPQAPTDTNTAAPVTGQPDASNSGKNETTAPATVPPATIAPPVPAPHHTNPVPARSAAATSVAQAPPADAGPSTSEQLEELDHNLDQLSSRQISVNASLDALQHQQAAQGLGLRGDIVAAQARVQANMAKAQAAIQAKDPKTAKKYLDMAEPDIEKLEKFLGR